MRLTTGSEGVQESSKTEMARSRRHTTPQVERRGRGTHALETETRDAGWRRGTVRVLG